jgi:hypothetical protein
MEDIHYIGGSYICSQCNQSHQFSEKIPIEKVRSSRCDHFIFTIIFKNDIRGFRVQVKSMCNKCYKEYNSELRIGQFSDRLYTDDSYVSDCCNNKLAARFFLSQEELDLNEATDNHAISLFQNRDDNIAYNNNNVNNNISNNIINNNNQHANQVNRNRNPNEKDIFNVKIEFDPANIIDFSKKTTLIYFMDEKANRLYKIYTSPNLRIKNALNELLFQHPEICYNKIFLFFNGNIVSLNKKISSFNLSDSCPFIIKSN